jgi:agmatine deiminase
MDKKNLFRLPAEWEKHEATWLGWPHNKQDWPGKFTPIPWVYAEIVKRISNEEKVRIVVESKEHQQKAKYVLSSANVSLSNVEFFYLKTDRGWMRDACPAFVKNDNEIASINFKFNAWSKYNNFKKDAKLPKFIARQFNLKNVVATLNDQHIVLEGGAIDVNGSGTLITTEECLLNSQLQVRNPGFSKSDYHEIFEKYLGISNVLWLAKGIAGDDTHGHVDDLCRFVNKSTLVLVQEKNVTDENYKSLKDFSLENGSKPDTVFLPMPEPVFFKGQRLPASYANFYISNEAVLVPTFNDPNDKIALGIIGELITDRPVVGIHSLDLVWGLGTIHCLTHEQPAI